MRRLPYETKIPIFQRARYLPNPGQVPIHQSTNDIDLISGGWRAGKSAVIAAEALPHTLIPSPRPYLGAFIGPTYAEPREEMAYIRDWLADMLPSSQFNPERDVSWPQDGKVTITIPPQVTKEHDGTIHFATLRSYTADEAVRIRAFNADFVVICEAGGIDEDAFYAIMGRVLSTGGFIIGSGTLETAYKWYHDAIKEGLKGVSKRGIRSFLLPSWTNLSVFEGGRDDPKIKRIEDILPADLFKQRVGAQPIRLSGVAVKEASLDHIKPVTFNPALPVEMAIDPGYTGAYSVLALQYYESGLQIIDEVYTRFKSTPEVVKMCQEREWWVNVSEHSPGVIDRAAKQHSSTDGRSVLELWYEHAGMWLDLTEATIPVSTGLEQLRVHLGIEDRITISPKCSGLLAEWDLGAFPDGFEAEAPWHYTRTAQGQLKGDDNLTGANHSSTALIYWLVSRYGFVTEAIMEYGNRPLLDMVEDDDYGVFVDGQRMDTLRGQDD